MRTIPRVSAAFAGVCAVALGLSGLLPAQVKQDRFTLTALNGVSFAEVKGYEDWKVAAPSFRTDKDEIRLILGNETVIKAYREGVPENGKPFPDGSILVKIAHSQRKSAAFPAALEPDVLQRVELMIKDAKKFAKTNGWGFARFVYDQKTGTFTVYGKDANFDQECSLCHTLVKARDFVFTHYPAR